MPIPTITTTPFSIGGNTRPPIGCQGVAITTFDIPSNSYRCFLIAGPSAGNFPANTPIGITSPVSATVKTLYLDGAAFIPDSQAWFIFNFNSNAGFTAPTDDFKIDILCFMADGETPVNCFSPTLDPLGVDTHIAGLDYTKLLSESGGGLTPVLTTQTGAKYSYNFSKIQELVGLAVAPAPFFFLPNINILPDGELLIKMTIIQRGNGVTTAQENYILKLKLE